MYTIFSLNTRYSYITILITYYLALAFGDRETIVCLIEINQTWCTKDEQTKLLWQSCSGRKRWSSSSSWLHLEHFLLIWTENLPTILPAGIVFPSILQAKVCLIPSSEASQDKVISCAKWHQSSHSFDVHMFLIHNQTILQRHRDVTQMVTDRLITWHTDRW